MIEYLLIIICAIFTVTAAHHDLRLSKAEDKHRSVNLALETVLEFNKHDNTEDIKFLDNVHNFIGKIKTVIIKNNILRRDFSVGRLEKFTDFVQMLIKILNKYKDKDLEHLFTIISEETRKYHYKGCKFHELIDNYSFRKYIAKKLDKLKTITGSAIKNKLKVIADKIEGEKYETHERELINFINSLYRRDSIDKFNKILLNIDDYRLKTRRNMDLGAMVKKGLRSIFFDYYTDLNYNVRAALKSKLDDYSKQILDVKKLLLPHINEDVHKHDRTTTTTEEIYYSSTPDIIKDILATSSLNNVSHPKYALRTRETLYDVNNFNGDDQTNLFKYWDISTSRKVTSKKKTFMTLYPAFVANLNTPKSTAKNDDITKKTNSTKKKPTFKNDKETTMENHQHVNYDSDPYDYLTDAETTTHSRNNLRQHRKRTHLKVVTTRPYTPGKIKKFNKFYKYDFGSNKPTNHTIEKMYSLKKYEIYLKRPKAHSKKRKTHLNKPILPLKKPKESKSLPIGLLMNDVPTIIENKTNSYNALNLFTLKMSPKNQRFKRLSTAFPTKRRTIYSTEESEAKEALRHVHKTIQSNKLPRIVSSISSKKVTANKEDSTTDDEYLTEEVLSKEATRATTFLYSKRRKGIYTITLKKQNLFANEDSASLVADNSKEGFKNIKSRPKITMIKQAHIVPSVSTITQRDLSLEDSAFFNDSSSEKQIKEQSLFSSNIPKTNRGKVVPTITVDGDKTTSKEEFFDGSQQNERIRQIKSNTRNIPKINHDNLIKYKNLTSKGYIGDNIYKRYPKEENQIITKISTINEYATISHHHKSPVTTNQYSYPSVDLLGDILSKGKSISATTETSQREHSRTVSKINIPSKDDYSNFEDIDTNTPQIKTLSSISPGATNKYTRSRKEEEAIFDDNLSVGGLEELGDASIDQLQILSGDITKKRVGDLKQKDIFNEHLPADRPKAVNHKRNNRRSNNKHMPLDRSILNRLQKLEKELKIVKTQIKNDTEIINDLKIMVQKKKQTFNFDKEHQKYDVINDELKDYTENKFMFNINQVNKVKQNDSLSDSNRSYYKRDVDYLYQITTEKEFLNEKNKRKEFLNLDTNIVNNHTNNFVKFNSNDYNQEKNMYSPYLLSDTKSQIIKNNIVYTDINENRNTKDEMVINNDDTFILTKRGSKKTRTPYFLTSIIEKDTTKHSFVGDTYKVNNEENQSPNKAYINKNYISDFQRYHLYNHDKLVKNKGAYEQNDAKNNNRNCNHRFDKLNSNKQLTYYRSFERDRANSGDSLVLYATDQSIHDAYKASSQLQILTTLGYNKDTKDFEKNRWLSDKRSDVVQKATNRDVRRRTKNTPRKKYFRSNKKLNQTRASLHNDILNTVVLNNNNPKLQYNRISSNVRSSVTLSSDFNRDKQKTYVAGINKHKTNVDGVQLLRDISSDQSKIHSNDMIISKVYEANRQNKTLVDSRLKYTSLDNPRKCLTNETLINNTRRKDVEKQNNSISSTDLKMLDRNQIINCPNNTNVENNTIDTKPLESIIEEEDAALQRLLHKNYIEKILLNDDWEKINPSKMFSEIDQITLPAISAIDSKLLAEMVSDCNAETTTNGINSKFSIPVFSSKFTPRVATLFPEIPQNIHLLDDDIPSYDKAVNLFKSNMMALPKQSRRIRPLAPAVGEERILLGSPLDIDRQIRERYRETVNNFSIPQLHSPRPILRKHIDMQNTKALPPPLLKMKQNSTNMTET